MSGIPGDLYGRLQAALLRCGPFDSDRALRSRFVDARLSAWRDALPEADSRVGRVQAVIDALSQRANPTGDNALALFLCVLADGTPPGDACHGQLAALAQEVAGALREAISPAGTASGPEASGPTIFNQQGQHVGTQINIAGDYHAAPTQPSITITGDGNVVGNGNTVRIDKATGSDTTATGPTVDVPALRARLQRLDAVSIESLCLDYFPVVYDKFTRGLQRGEMINLLLDHCRRNPEDAARLIKLL